MEIDASSGVVPVNLRDWSANDSGTYRGVGSSWFNAENIAREDFMRNEQAAQNQFARDMEQMYVANDFTASEAEKAFERQKYLRDTAYQSTVEDMKKAGLNPILAYQQGGSSTPSTPSASSVSPSRSSAYRSGTGREDPLNSLVGTVARLVGIYLSGKVSLQADIARDSARLDKQLLNSLSLESAKLDNQKLYDYWKYNYFRRNKK